MARRSKSRRKRRKRVYPCVRKTRAIDRRAKGPGGRTKSGKYIRSPRAYVFGGMRKHGWKPSHQRRRKRR